MIHVGQLAPGDQWDQTILDRLFGNRLYPTGLEFKRCAGYPNSHGCALIIPGRYWHTLADIISEAIATYSWVLAFRSSDEEDLFDIAKVDHPNIKWWVQSPRTDRDYGDARLYGIGFTPHFGAMPKDPCDKHLNVFLSAQNTHERRARAFELLRESPTAVIRQTAGFAQGLDPAAYADMMRYAKVAPAPSGPASPDTFRVFEALQAHTIPIADDITPRYDSAGYWRRLFPDVPFPVLTKYADLTGYIDDQLRAWPANANRITAWWIRQKRRYAHWLREDLEKLGAI